MNYNIFSQNTPGTYSVQIPIAGIYKIECWGAKGGGNGGNGGYSSGKIKLFPQTVQCNVGGVNGFNGGGSGRYYGGGGSDVRIGAYTLYDRIIVAGGGGSSGAASRYGGFGGGTDGQTRTESYGGGGGGASQSAAGGYRGSFGQGGYGNNWSGGYGGAGGGGWFGGGGVDPDGSADDDRGGGGGSGYVLTATSYKPSGYNPAVLEKFTEAQLINGGTTMPTFDGASTMVGNASNGYVRITLVQPFFSAMTFAILTEDGKYYIPNKDYYDFINNEFIPVTLDHIKDYKANYYKYIYDVRDLNKRIYMNDSLSFLPFNKLNMHNAKIFRFEVFDPDFVNQLLADTLTGLGAFYDMNNYIYSPLKVTFKYNTTSDNLMNSLIKLTGFNQDDNYDDNFLDVGISNTKALIKYRDKFYGEDFKETVLSNILLDGFEGERLNSYAIRFLGDFEVYIAFKNKTTDVATKLKIVSFHTREFQSMNRVVDSDTDIYRDKDNDMIYMKVNSAYNNLLIKKLENTEIQYDKSIETF